MPRLIANFARYTRGGSNRRERLLHRRRRRCRRRVAVRAKEKSACIYIYIYIYTYTCAHESYVAALSRGSEREKKNGNKYSMNWNQRLRKRGRRLIKESNREQSSIARSIYSRAGKYRQVVDRRAAAAAVAVSRKCGCEKFKPASAYILLQVMFPEAADLTETIKTIRGV